MPRWLVPLLLLLLFSVRANAQDFAPADASAHFAYLIETVTGAQLAGAATSITGNINRLTGITGELFFGGYGVYSVLGGPRLTSRRDARLMAYAQFLIGGVGVGRRGSFAFQPGAGLEFGAASQVRIRAGGDLLHIPETGDGPADFLRLHVGLVLPLGTR